MKKLVLVLLVALLSVPAFAADPTITLVAGSGTGEVDVMYNSDGTAPNLPSGIGLVVTSSGAAKITQVKNYKQGVSTSSSKGYGIFLGQLVTDGVSITDANTPVVGGQNVAGVTTNNDNSVTLEFGALYKRSITADAPATNGRLCTIKVDGNCTVTVTGDAVSCGTGKGIVAQDYAAYPVDADNSVALAVTASAPAPTVASISPNTGLYNTTVPVTITGTGFAGSTVKISQAGSADIAGTSVVVVNSTTITANLVLPKLTRPGAWNVVVTNGDAQTVTLTGGFTVADCLKASDVGYAAWVTFGKPDCWCFQKQCRGDINGTSQGPLAVGSIDLTAFRLAFNQPTLPAGGICADLNHSAQGPLRVGSVDLTTFRLYFNQPVVTVCPMTNINGWKN